MEQQNVVARVSRLLTGVNVLWDRGRSNGAFEFLKTLFIIYFTYKLLQNQFISWFGNALARISKHFLVQN